MPQLTLCSCSVQTHSVFQSYSRPALRLGQRRVRMASIQRLPCSHFELDDTFSGVIDEHGMMTVAGFGSLLSPTSARSTFPDLRNFRVAKIMGWRRVFAHTCAIFFERGIANWDTLEISSLSVEPHEGAETIVTLFEVEATPEAVKAFIDREHEFRFVAARPAGLDGSDSGRLAVVCARNSDEHYKATRCSPEEWEAMYGRWGIHRIWRDDIKPCRVYLRHCVLAAEQLGPEVLDNFLDQTFLGDRTTTVRQWIAANPGILQELPPPSLIGRYSG